ncbi:hypothetical protein FACS1894126_0700 [Alphaproteobacteria bacterium]|nr:hypothetical protein FACS1894126_0700 [Alphaproteobacteria bacterium]
MIRQLNISNYETYLVLGNEEHERRKWRPVVISISVRFPNDFQVCDNIECTVCYYSLLDFIDKKLENEEFRLIERVAEYVYDAVSEYVNYGNILKRVEVIKPRPISNKNLESASFVCSDW